MVCSVCGLLRQEVEVIDVSDSNDSDDAINFSILQVKDPHIVDVGQFQYGADAINSTVLCKAGVKFSKNKSVVINVCTECHSSLLKNHVPRLSLANYLYRGDLPHEFRDLTWIEEMVCAKYRNTTHITRLYGSTDPSQPKVFHGNTCAHEMNVLSTATVLPRTVADMNDMLTIIFVGPNKFDPNCLKNMFTIRKGKVWSFLLWLTKFNHLYCNIQLDSSIMDSYPVYGLLPDIKYRIFLDHETDALDTFTEETAGFAEHPAQLLSDESNVSNSQLSPPTIFIEKMGVSDPDGVKSADVRLQLPYYY